MKKLRASRTTIELKKDDVTAKRTDHLDRRLKKIIFILLLGGIAPLIDTTIVNVAITTLQKELHASVAEIQWVNTAYLLAIAMAIPITGWSVKRYGGKQMWLFSLLIFLGGSILCGFAWNTNILIICRVIQGLGAGLMQPIMMTLLTQASGKQRLGRVLTLATLFAVIVPILGPAIGGLMIKNLSWNWIFFVNVPICITAVVLARIGLPEDKSQGAKHLDILGLLLLSPSMALIIYSLSQAALHKNFNDPFILGLLGTGFLLLFGFIWNALYTKSEPVVNLHLFKIKRFSIAATLLFLSGFAFFGASFLIPLFFQRIYKADALTAGLFLSLQGVGSLLSRWVGKYVDHTGSKPIILFGMFAAAAGTFVFTQADPHSNKLWLDFSLVIRGAGLSAANIAIMAAAYQDLPAELLPDASSITRILQQLGGSFGVALIAIILQQHKNVLQQSKYNQSLAFNNAFSWTLAFTLVAFALALLLPRKLGSRT